MKSEIKLVYEFHNDFHEHITQAPYSQLLKHPPCIPSLSLSHRFNHLPSPNINWRLVSLGGWISLPKAFQVSVWLLATNITFSYLMFSVFKACSLKSIGSLARSLKTNFIFLKGQEFPIAFQFDAVKFWYVGVILLCEFIFVMERLYLELVRRQI